MKKNIFLLPAIISLISISVVSCNNSTEDKTTETVVKTDTIVIKENKDVVTVVVATPEEWNAFKDDAEAKIEANEKRIVELKAKMNKPGKLLDKMRADRIAALEQRNRDLRLKITAYETEKTDWQKFKEEFNHDMDELGKAIGDIFSDDK
jgi:chromosome segregation ATPase